MKVEIIWKKEPKFGTKKQIETRVFESIWTDNEFPNCLMYRNPSKGPKRGTEGSLMKDRIARLTVVEW